MEFRAFLMNVVMEIWFSKVDGNFSRVPEMLSGPGIATALRAGRSGDLIPVEARFSASVQTGPGAHPASCTMGTGSLPRVKRPGRGVDHPPHLAPRFKEE